MLTPAKFPTNDIQPTHVDGTPKHLGQLLASFENVKRYVETRKPIYAFDIKLTIFHYFSIHFEFANISYNIESFLCSFVVVVYGKIENYHDAQRVIFSVIKVYHSQWTILPWKQCICIWYIVFLNWENCMFKMLRTTFHAIKTKKGKKMMIILICRLSKKFSLNLFRPHRCILSYFACIFLYSHFLIEYYNIFTALFSLFIFFCIHLPCSTVIFHSFIK